MHRPHGAVLSHHMRQQICGEMRLNIIGNKHRLAALEYLPVDGEMSELIVNRSVFGAFDAARTRKGLLRLEDAAERLVAERQTDRAEVNRVLGARDVE